MSLLAPAWLALLALGPLLVLLHRRRARQSRTLSSTFLWRRLQGAESAVAPEQRSPWNRFLALQLLIVALVALALARPVFSPGDAGTVPHTAFLVTQPGVEAPVVDAAGAIWDVDPDAGVSVLTAGRDVDPHLLEGQRADERLERLAETGFGSARTDWGRLVAWMDAFWAREGPDRVVVVGDAGNAAAARRGLKGTTWDGRLRWLEAESPDPEARSAPTRREAASEAGNEGDRTDRMQVLVVGEPAPVLQDAFEAIRGSEQPLEWDRRDELPDASERYDLVVAHETGLDRHPGTHVWWIGQPPGSGSRADPVDDARSWVDPGHPLADVVDWDALWIDEARPVSRGPGSTVLLGHGSDALFQVRTTRAGHEIHQGFSLEATDWPERVDFPRFVEAVLQWIGTPEADRPVTAGDRIALDPRWLDADARWLGPGGRDWPLPAGWQNGEGDAPDYLPRGYTIDVPVPVPGVWTLRSGDGVERTFRVTPPEEDAEAADAVREAAPVRWGAPVPLGGWVFLAAVMVLGLEGWLAGRLRGGFLDPVRLRPGAAGAARRWVVLGSTGLAVAALTAAALGTVWPERASTPAYVQVLEPGVSDPEAVEQRDLPGVWVGDFPRPVGPETPLAADTTSLDLEAALRAAAAGSPGADHARLLLDARGAETRGRMSRALQDLAAEGIAIDAVPRGGRLGPEPALDQVQADPAPRAGGPFRIHAQIDAESAGMVPVVLLRDGEVHEQREVQLEPGRQRIGFQVEEDAAGERTYAIAIGGRARAALNGAAEADRDRVPARQRAAVRVDILPAPRVAVVGPDDPWTGTLVDALGGQGIEVERLSGEELDDRFGGGRVGGAPKPDVVLLSDQSMLGIRARTQREIRSWVEQEGGGLLVLGGSRSFGAGAYHGSDLDPVLPLGAELPHERPELAIGFVLDRSGSMRALVRSAEGHLNRLDLAKQAIREALTLMRDESQLSLVVFDHESEVLVPLTPASERATIETLLDRLQPGGRTHIHPAIQLARDQLRDVGERFNRHVVVVTDGLAQDGPYWPQAHHRREVDEADYEGLIRSMVEEGITVSGVAIGDGADERLMEDVAEWGLGTAYATEDFEAFPAILAQEVLRLDDGVRVNETYRPVVTARTAPFLQQVFDDSPDAVLPPLDGLIRTEARSGAQVHLRGPDDAPVLASWRYGLGRVLAFTAQGPWSARWQAHDAWPVLWAQAVRWAMPPATERMVHALPEQSDPEAWRPAHGGAERILAAVEATGGRILGTRMDPDALHHTHWRVREASAPWALIALGAFGLALVLRLTSWTPARWWRLMPRLRRRR